jgi:hypothetical protein
MSQSIPWNDVDLDCGIRSEIAAVLNMLFRVPMPNAPSCLAEKVEAALISQVSEIADQISNGMVVTSSTVPLKNGDGLGGPGNVVGFISHASPSAITTFQF